MSSATMIYSEMLDIIECPEAYIQKDFEDRMYELMDILKKDKEGEEINNLIYEIEKNRHDNTYCPKCGEHLRIRENQEGREYQGFDCSETISTEYCLNCGWTEDKD